jgi:hypothetical protein
MIPRSGFVLSNPEIRRWWWWERYRIWIDKLPICSLDPVKGFNWTCHLTGGRFLKQGVCHTVALPFTLKNILWQKKNYGNSNISPRQNIIFRKSSKKKLILQNIITLELISSFNTSQNIIFQKSSYKNRPIT